jgi:hypothetical protein
VTQDIQRQAQRSAGHLVSTFLIAAGAGVLVLLAVAALLLWGFNGKTLILDMVAFFCV